MTSSNTSNNLNTDSLNSRSIGPLNNRRLTSQGSSSSGRLFRQLALLQNFSPQPSCSTPLSFQQPSLPSATQTHSLALASLQASNALSSSSSPAATPLSSSQQSLAPLPFRSSFSVPPQRRSLSRTLNFDSATSSFLSSFAPSSSSSSSIDPLNAYHFTLEPSYSFSNTTLPSSCSTSSQTNSEDSFLSEKLTSSSSSSTDPSKTHPLTLPSLHSYSSSSFHFSSMTPSSTDPEDFLLFTRVPSSSSSSASTPSKLTLSQQRSPLNSPLSFSPSLYCSSSTLTPQTHSGSLFLSPHLTPSSSSSSSSSPFSPPFSLDHLSLTSPTLEGLTAKRLSSPQEESSHTSLMQTTQKRKLPTREETETQTTQSPSRNPSTESPSSKGNIKKKLKCPNTPNAKKKVIDERAIDHFMDRLEKEQQIAASIKTLTPLETEVFRKKKMDAESCARAARIALMVNSSHQLKLSNGKTYQLSFLGKGEFKITYAFAPQQERFIEQFANEELVIKVYDLDSPHISLRILNTLNLNQMKQSAELQKEIAQEEDISAAYILNDPEKDGFIVQRKINPLAIDLDAFFRQLRLIENQQMISTLPSSSKKFLSQLRAFFTLGARLATPLDLAKEDNIFIDQTTGKATLIDFYELSEEYASKKDPFGPFSHMIRGLELWSQGNKEIIQYFLIDIQSLAQKNDLHCTQAMHCYKTLIAKKEAKETSPKERSLLIPDLDKF